MGFGTMPVIDQVAICLICVLDGSWMDYGPGQTTGSTNTNATPLTPYVDTVDAPPYTVAHPPKPAQRNTGSEL